MTAKKDLKKKKSKKKVKKNRAKYYSSSKNNAVEEKYVPISEAVSRDKSVAIISLIETGIVMALSIAMIIAKPGSKMGKRILGNNIALLNNFLTPTVLIVLEAVMFACMLVYLYKSVKSKLLRKFYYTGVAIAAIALVFTLTQDISKFVVYGYGIIGGFVIIILQFVKLYYVDKIEKQYADEEKKILEEKESKTSEK